MTRDAANQKQGTTAKAKPVPLTDSDRTSFVDLQLQQAAEAAEKAQSGGGDVAAAKVAVALMRAALGAHGADKRASKTLLKTLDGAYAKFYDLYNQLAKHNDRSMALYAVSDIRGLLMNMETTFAKDDWAPPKNAKEVAAREEVADKADATHVTPEEKLALASLHLRTARERLVADWDAITAGRVDALTHANNSLTAAKNLLINPGLRDELSKVDGDIAAIEQVFQNLVLLFEDKTNKKALFGLAHELDGLARLVQRAPGWSGQVGAPAPGKDGKEPAKDATPTNETDPGPPRGEPAQHRIVERREWKRMIHLTDYNYTDEYLGYIELYMEAFQTPSGQVYVQVAKATKRLTGRAAQYLSMISEVVTHSVNETGNPYAEVKFNITLQGPNKSETSSSEIGMKVGVGGDDGNAEVSGGLSSSKSVSSADSRAIRREYVINSLTAKKQQIDLSNINKPDAVMSAMELFERTNMRLDFDDFEIDDDDVGGGLTDSDWIIESEGG